jgi:hypothetical protein
VHDRHLISSIGLPNGTFRLHCRLKKRECHLRRRKRTYNTFP